MRVTRREDIERGVVGFLDIGEPGGVAYGGFGYVIPVSSFLTSEVVDPTPEGSIRVVACFALPR